MANKPSTQGGGKDGKDGKKNKNNEQSVKALLDKFDKATTERDKVKDELAKEKEKSKPLYELNLAIEAGTAPANLIDLNISDRDLSFEDARILTAYQEVQNALKAIQSDIISSDPEGQSKKMEESFQRSYLTMIDDRIRTEKLLNEIVNNMNTSTLAYDRMRKIMESGFGRDIRTSHTIRALITSFDHYVETSAAENNRLRNITSLNVSNVDTVSGGRCIEPPKANALGGRYECMADTLEEVKKGWFSSGKQRVKKIEQVSKEAYNKYYDNKEEYDRRNRFGGLEGNKFVKDVTNPIVGRVYILMTQIIVEAKRMGSNAPVQFPIGVGAALSYIGTQGGIATFGNKHTFRLIDKENREVDETVRRFSIDRGDLYLKDIHLQIKDIVERL
jgi:hypothetical protein